MSGTQRYVICIRNPGHAAALELRKVYRSLDDESAETRGLLRVIDESGEDYLYPCSFFAVIEVPREARHVFRANKTRAA